LESTGWRRRKKGRRQREDGDAPKTSFTPKTEKPAFGLASQGLGGSIQPPAIQRPHPVKSDPIDANFTPVTMRIMRTNEMQLNSIRTRILAADTMY